MFKFLISFILLLGVTFESYGQVVMPIVTIPEHGFLAGKKFQFYPTIEKFDFHTLRVKVALYDDRNQMNLTKVNCSEIGFTNTSEFEAPDCIYLVGQYIDTLLRQAGASIDSSSSNIIEIHLEGIDARMINIGFAKIRAHGLCQLRIKYNGIDKIYCTDITDADKNSPVGPNAFVTRKTATRIIASASIRETFEAFFRDIVH